VSPAGSHSVRTMCRLKRASESLSFLVSSACVSAVPRAVVSRTRTSPAPRRRRETNWKIVTRCAPRRTRGFRGRLRPPLEGSAGHPPGGSGRAFPRVPTAQAGSNPAPVRISVRAVRGTRRQSRRSSARAKQKIFYGLRPGSADGVPKNLRDTRISGRPTDGRVGRKYRGV
jgi:hypothetical protein